MRNLLVNVYDAEKGHYQGPQDGALRHAFSAPGKGWIQYFIKTFHFDGKIGLLSIMKKVAANYCHLSNFMRVVRSWINALPFPLC